MESEQHFGVSNVNEPTATNGDANKPGNILKNSQKVYRGDIVRKKATTGIGAVAEVFVDSDSGSSMADDESDSSMADDESDSSMADDVYDEDDGKNDEVGNAADNDNNNYKQIPLNADPVRVLWLDGTESTEGTDNVKIVDRRFFIGEYVASANDPTGQIGVVVDFNINVDLLTHDGSVLIGIPSKNLRRIRNFDVGDYVVLGPWLGIIKRVFDNVTVQLDDGSICAVMKADPEHLKQVGKYIPKYVQFPYTVGQRVKDTTSYVFKNARWLSGLWKANNLEGTVIKVTEVSVLIHWIISNLCGPDSFTTPAEEQIPKNLKLYSFFSHTKWYLGACCLLPSSQDSSSTMLNKGLLKLDSNDSAQDKPVSNETDYNEFYEEVITAEEYVNMLENISEASLNKNAETSANNASVPASKEVVETWPIHRKKILKMIVSMDKKSQKKKTESLERALLIVKTRSNVDVAWQDGNLNRGMDSTSLIRIDSPGDHEFVAEQYVVEKAADSENAIETRRVGLVKSVNAKDQTACVKWLKPVAKAWDPREFDKEEFVCVYELEGHPDYDYTFGDFAVRFPPISLPESSTRHEMSTEFSELAWVGNITGLKDGNIEVTWADGMLSTVDRQAVHIFRRNDDEYSTSGSESTDEDDMDSVDNSEEHGLDADDTRSEIESDLSEVAETLRNFKLPQLDAPACEELSFKSFDIVTDPPVDHYFLDKKGQNNMKWFKKIQQEWRILLNSLPEGVYVRVYEDRMDLLRAAIVGASGTPYHDGLFFFDFQLTSEYPDVAPSVHYHSRGLRMNPNLNEDGKICLSLLNTWTGIGNERWSRSTSSILQVVVSLQGLVLNTQPYFNEAGYGKQVGTLEGEKKSVAYNENTFVLNCKKMIYEIRKPPKDFEGFVIKHYRERGYYILKACDAYIKGHLVGSLGKDASLCDDSSTDSNSKGFRLLLRKIAPRLFSAFTEVGADCQEFEHFNQIES